MAIHNKSHHNHALMSLNKQSKKAEELKPPSNSDPAAPEAPVLYLQISDCMDFLKQIPDNSIQLISIDPPYNIFIENWDVYDNYTEWAAQWLDEAYRVLNERGSLVIFGGMQFRDDKSGDLIDIIHYVRHKTKFRLVNTIIWHYKNGMSACRYFANRHEEIIWLTKSDKYYFDLDAVREPYSEKDLALALKDKRLNPENVRKGKNPTNVWEIGRLNGNSKERVGHPTQKPLAIIERLVLALSCPGSTVLDFFAGSGTTGRVCIAAGRNCLLCDSSPTTLEYFARHLAHMEAGREDAHYESALSVAEFFEKTERRNSSLVGKKASQTEDKD